MSMTPIPPERIRGSETIFRPPRAGPPVLHVGYLDKHALECMSRDRGGGR
jgi:hypothetical protein